MILQTAVASGILGQCCYITGVAMSWGMVLGRGTQPSPLAVTDPLRS